MVELLIETRDTHLRFVCLDLASAKMVHLTDASFSIAKGFKYQLGYTVALVDKIGRAKIVHYGSNRCLPVSRRVMVAEVQG